MSQIVEILGEKKFSGSVNRSLVTRVLFEETNKLKYENNSFYTVNRSIQYNLEREQSNNYRIYGKVNPIINTNINTQLTINLDKLSFNDNNWSILILKSKRYETAIDSNNNPIYSKGVKEVIKTQGNNTILNINLKDGLPGKAYLSSKEDNLYGIIFMCGHNFVLGDTVYITSNKPNTPPTGLYQVKRVLNNIIYIDFPAVTINTNVSIDSDTSTLANTTIGLTNITDTQTTPNQSNIVSGIVFDDANFTNLTEEYPSINPKLNPDFHVAKIVDKEKLQYYIKTLEVIDIINDFDDCAFSINAYNNQIKSFVTTKDINLTNDFNNLSEPTTELYLAFVKKYDSSLSNFSNLESHFEMFIDTLAPNDGLEILTDIINTPNRPIRVGDLYYHSLCEYTHENLNEIEITKIYHRFIHGGVSFHYNPFIKKTLKLKSSYIEDGDIINQPPNYAVYSRQRDKHIWRDILNVGVSDENGDIIDYPFLNGGHYVYIDVNFFVKTEKNKTKKHILNTNDLNNISGNVINSELQDVIRSITNENDIIKPFNNFRDQIC